MGKFKQRSEAKELMDKLDSGGEEIKQTLQELKIINRWLGGNAVTTNGLKKLLSTSRSISIVDLGCGGGDMLKLMSAWCRKKAYNVKLSGIDANPNIIAYARENTRAYQEINYIAADVFSEKFSELKFDVATATLFCHHVTDQQLIELLRQLKTQAKIGIIINDLHRHWFAYYSILMLTRLFSKSEMVKHDASLSVLRSFRKEDWKKILNAAGIKHFDLRWKWAFRWQLVIYTGLA